MVNNSMPYSGSYQSKMYQSGPSTGPMADFGSSSSARGGSIHIQGGESVVMFAARKEDASSAVDLCRLQRVDTKFAGSVGCQQPPLRPNWGRTERRHPALCSGPESRLRE
eukprot:1399612-Rhodomonas_salina.5